MPQVAAQQEGFAAALLLLLLLLPLRRSSMGGCPSTEEAPCYADGTVVSSRRELWTPALQMGGGCNHKLLEEVLLGERRFVADMHVRKGSTRLMALRDLGIEATELLGCGAVQGRGSRYKPCCFCVEHHGLCCWAAVRALFLLQARVHQPAQSPEGPLPPSSLEHRLGARIVRSCIAAYVYVCVD